MISTVAVATWILWIYINQVGMIDSWTPQQAFPDQASCESYALDLVDGIITANKGLQKAGPFAVTELRNGGLMLYRCYPDTFDPRGDTR
jgi:hypothetical protein